LSEDEKTLFRIVRITYRNPSKETQSTKLVINILSTKSTLDQLDKSFEGGKSKVTNLLRDLDIHCTNWTISYIQPMQDGCKALVKKDSDNKRLRVIQKKLCKTLKNAETLQSYLATRYSAYIQEKIKDDEVDREPRLQNSDFEKV